MTMEKNKCVNSFTILESDIDEFKLTPDITGEDFMKGQDISWVSQVAPFIVQYSKPDEIVFDPFVGLGTTMIGCGINNRKGIGIEVDPSRFGFLKRRMDKFKQKFQYYPELILGDSMSVEYPKNVDLICTNPPYYHLGEDGTDDNVYRISEYEKWLSYMRLFFVKCRDSLKAGGFIVCFSENIRMKNGNMIPQAYDMCKIIQELFDLKDERIICYKKESDPNAVDVTLTNRAHEYVLIAQKKFD